MSSNKQFTNKNPEALAKQGFSEQKKEKYFYGCPLMFGGVGYEALPHKLNSEAVI